MIDFVSLIEATGLAFAVDVAIRSTLFLLLFFAVHALLGRRLARARSALWNGAVTGLLVLPWACAALPRAEIAILPASTAATNAETVAAETSSVPDAPPQTTRSIEPTRDEARSFGEGPEQWPRAARTVQRALVVAPSPTPGPVAPSRAAGRSSTASWSNLATAVLGIYGTIAAILFLKLAGSLMALGRLTAAGRPITAPEWTEAFERCRAWVGAPRRARLLMSDAVSVPLAAGWLRPVVIVPSGLAATRDAQLIDAVLVHELGHVRRGDFAWELALRLARVVYWPHPLVWALGRFVRDAREQACDDLCIFALGGASAYRASLITVAAAMVRRPGPALGMAMAHATKLGRRLEWIDLAPGAPRCLPRRPARLALALASVTAIAALSSIRPAPARAVPGPAQEAASAARAAKTGATDDATAKDQAAPHTDEKADAVPAAIEIVVRSKSTGRPLPGAKIRAWLDLTSIELKAGPDGRARIDLASRSLHGVLTIDVWADEHVQQRYFFHQNDRRHPKIPAHFTVDLLPGEQTLGGKVTDDQGKPIAGAKVKVWSYIDKKEPHELAFMVDARTDERGEWRCRCFRNAKFAYLFISHPDFLSDDDSHARRHGRPRPSKPARPNEQPLQKLLDFTDVQVMTRGAELSGTVSDQAGGPIAGAEVGWTEAGQQFAFHDALATTTTDRDGRFRFPHARPGKLMLQAKARGHAPEMKTIKLDARAAPLNVAMVLPPPHVVSGQVVDMHDQPIAGVLVVLDAWRGYRSLGVHMYTDRAGRFRWDSAPAVPGQWNFSKLGFASVLQRSLSTENGGAVVRLKRALEISGRLRDAATNQPIDATAKVEVGVVDSKTGKVAWSTNTTAFSLQGRLQASIDAEKARKFRLRIRADGYAPFESRVFDRDEGAVEFDPPLTKMKGPQGVPVQGTVARPDGAPLAGAQVAVAYSLNGERYPLPSVRIENGKIVPHEGQTVVKSDAQGRFALAREPNADHWAVVVTHPEFYGVLDGAEFARRPTITARPWGRVEGFARIGRRPAGDMAVRLSGDRLVTNNVPYIQDAGTARTDANGHFAFDRVVPGDVRVARQFEMDQATITQTWSNGMLVEVRAGETAQVKLGGRGRPVVARIVPPPGAGPSDDYTVHSAFTIESDRPDVPYPQDVLKRDPNARIDWFKTWRGSDAGRAYRRDFFRLRQARLQSNKALRIEDVPPGEYRLTLVYSADPLRGPSASPERAAYVTRQFRVPEGPGDQPIDLGELRPRRKETLKVGSPAPPFDVETLEGRRVKLEDFHGKYLVLDFWATWCGPCAAELPDLKALFERFRVDERFAVLGLSLDEDKQAPRQYAEAQGLHWPQGFLGRQDKTGVADAYRVETVPAFVLIGPDGKIQATARRAEVIAGAVAHALSVP